MQSKVTETNDIQIFDGETLTSDNQGNQQQIHHMKQYINSAKTILSDASVYAGSVSGTVVGHPVDVANMADTFGSVLGLDDDRRQRIAQWLPGEPAIEGMSNIIVSRLFADFSSLRT